MPDCSAPKVREGWEAARLCVSRKAKPAKIVSLIEKDFCARPIKDLSNFAGFAGRCQAASRWVGVARSARHWFSLVIIFGKISSRKGYNFTASQNSPFYKGCF